MMKIRHVLLAISVSLSGLVVAPINVGAKVYETKRDANYIYSLTNKGVVNWVRDVLGFNPPDQGRESNIRSGGRRGPCNNIDLPLRAFVPIEGGSDGVISAVNFQGNQIASALAKTSTSHPTFWFYVPELPNVSEAQFELLTSRGKNVLSTSYLSVPLTQRSEIIGFQLPANEAGLSQLGLYQWSISLICDVEDPANNPSVYGWLEYSQVNHNLEDQSVSTNRLEKYSETYGLWHETLTELFQLMQLAPSNTYLRATWENLLREHTATTEEAILSETNINWIQPLR